MSGYAVARVGIRCMKRSGRFSSLVPSYVRRPGVGETQNRSDVNPETIPVVNTWLTKSRWGKHCLMRSGGPAGHDADHGDLDHRPAALQRVLVVPVQPPPPGQPPERPLPHPPPRLYLEPPGPLPPGDDGHHQVEQDQ